MTAGRTVNSQSQDWSTPKIYVDAVKDVFGIIHLDPCSNNHSIVNAKVEYSLPTTDGLRASWNYPTIYVNPPYGSDRERSTSIKDWLRRCAKAYEDHNSEVIALIPVAPNTRHWKEQIFGKASAICFLYDTRLRFLENGKDQGKGAPMACAMIYWGERTDKFNRVFMHFGAVVNITDLKGKVIGSKHKSSPFYLMQTVLS